MRKILHRAAFALAIALAAGAGSPVWAQSRNLAPGFTVRAPATKLVVVPADMELFSLSAGGVAEPRADWTATAQQHFRTALLAQKDVVGTDLVEFKDKDMDELVPVNTLHGAVAQAVWLHHMLGIAKLPTKEDRLDWSLGEAVKPLRDKSGADYALFFWIRDSYASPERKAAMVALAIVGIGITGGIQIGYASLVDLRDGRIVWFNNLGRAFGDLREAKPAEETVEALLKGFPARRP
ncbi:hypothetical protein FN976_08120 [Caenimonas sedimenti]|uniref:Uncharacterized protein n=1 Tax=Caenimonas sedimenti TaxID=2596921 RepID=A0A562ZUW2_9BURK|nr:hypothetical protein [Caenimonas sedimenti]TWO71944.1 hypothetical protein FN976_08120 [Caenimonas sedimenti]